MRIAPTLLSTRKTKLDALYIVKIFLLNKLNINFLKVCLG